jgi:hypothetical protein
MQNAFHVKCWHRSITESLKIGLTQILKVCRIRSKSKRIGFTWWCMVFYTLKFNNWCKQLDLSVRSGTPQKAIHRKLDSFRVMLSELFWSFQMRTSYSKLIILPSETVPWRCDCVHTPPEFSWATPCMTVAVRPVCAVRGKYSEMMHDE